MPASQAPKSRHEKPSRARVRQRTRALRQEIGTLDFLVSGTLHIRTKVCGKKNCRCAEDPEARHGPYHEWSRHQEGRLIHKVITPVQAKLVARAIANYQRVLELLDHWEAESTEEILGTATSSKG